MRYPPGWSASLLEPLACDEEIFLLHGRLKRGPSSYGVRDYAYLPAGFAGEVQVRPEGALAVTFLASLATPIAASVAALQLAEDLGNVSRACQVVGYHRDKFIRTHRHDCSGRKPRDTLEVSLSGFYARLKQPIRIAPGETHGCWA